MKIRNKITGQIHEVIAGTLYAKNIFEKVTDDIRVGEPKVEYKIEEIPEKLAKKSSTQKRKETIAKKKTTKKGAKKNETSK